MEIFLISFVVLVLAVSGMAVGVLFGRESIRGSCGGLNKIAGLNLNCLLCRKRTCPSRVDRKNSELTEQDTAKVN